MSPVQSRTDYSFLLQAPEQLQALFQSYDVTLEHPVLKLPTAAQVVGILKRPAGRQVLEAGFAEREKLIQLMKADPLHYGYEWPWYADARRLLTEYKEVLVLAGNDTGKSWFGAKWSCEQLEQHDEIDFIFGHMTEDSSKDQQQQLVYQFMPPGWKGARRSQHVDLTFRDKAGFTDNKFVVSYTDDTGSVQKRKRGFFLFYKQETGRLTGYKVRAAWADELITLPFLEELRTRMLGRDGRLLITFTPRDGYTPAVAEFLAGAEIVEWRPSKYLPAVNLPIAAAPAGHMPYILKCRRSSAAVICAFSEWSPFREVSELERMIENKSTDFIKCRLYGFPEKMGGVALPNFGPVNIIKRKPGVPVLPGLVRPHPWKDLYPTLGAKGFNVQFIDPGEDKNWFIKWYRISPEPEFIQLYREWPDMPTCGEWALPGDKHDGVPGPAQRYQFGRGIVGYKRLILEAEGWVWHEQEKRWDNSNAEVMGLRSMDSRIGGKPVPSEMPQAEDMPGVTSLIAQMADEQRDSAGNLIGPSMDFLPAPGDAVKGGLQMLSNYFDYDARTPVSLLNCPHWYVVEDCQQSIYAYREYTGLDGAKGALKDVIDPDRYLAKSDLHYAEPCLLQCEPGWGY